jgi:excisionase family DNA binding protein
MLTLGHANRRAALLPRLLSMKQAMYELSIGRTKFYELINAEKLQTVMIGRRRYITVEALDAFIAGLSADGRPA